MKNYLLFKAWAGDKPLLPLQMLLLFWITISSAQQMPITGTVFDTQGALPGVNVTLKNKTFGTTTDAKGNFQITAIAEDTLVFSSVGYVTVETVVGMQTTLKIILQPDENVLKEVLVNAGYYKVKDKERTGSIAKITAKDIETQPVGNVLGALQGRMAGVEIIQDSGSPGGGFQIKIRGQNSLRTDGNNPLYIIDGVPYSSETIGWNVTSGQQPSMTSPLNSINPTDIESIEVLKDGDATAIYGSRGANGVVLITTKVGKSGAMRVNIHASTSAGTITKKIDLMKTEQYLTMRRQAFINDGITTFPSSAYDLNGSWDQNRYTDWQEELLGGTAEITQVQTSLSGGSEQTNYLLSGTTRTETTVYPGNFKYNRGGVHFNMNHHSLDNRFKLTFSTNYNSQNNTAPVADLTRIALRLAPNAPAIYDNEGNLNWADGTWDNPLAPFNSVFKSNIKDLNANAVLSYSLLKNVWLQSSFGYTELRNNESTIQPNTTYNPSYGLGPESSTVNYNQTTRDSWIIEPQLNWSFIKGNHRLQTLVGATFQSQTTNRLFQWGYGFASNSLIYDLASAFQKFVDFSDESKYKYQAFYGRVNYNYEGRYLVNLTARRDGSSRFGSGKQFATFGALGAAWIFSNEAFLKNQSILSFGKLRSSYGITGNDQIGDYQFLDTYVSSGNDYEGTTGLVPSRLYNANFGWETNYKSEIALETGFFKDRIFTTVAYYNNRSTNQLVGTPLPGTTGFPSLTSNLDAKVENKGFEFTLRTVNLKSKEFEWNTSFNIALNKNKLLSYPGLENAADANRYVVGESIKIIKLYKYLGINPITGLYQFEDVNEDGIISSLGDRQTIADLTPKYFGGIQNQFVYKQIQLDFLFQFVKQQGMAYATSSPGRSVNQLASITNTWQSGETNASYQLLSSGANGAVTSAYGKYNQSNAALEDASYIRMKSILLAYQVPLNVTSGVKCRLYLQGQNLLTFTSFYADPEFKFAGYLPPLKTYTLGIQLTF